MTAEEGMMNLDPQDLIVSLGGESAVASMTHEERADGMEHYMFRATVAGKVPSVAEVEAQITTRPSRRGAGNLFVSHSGNVRRLEAMPPKPTLADFFQLRFETTSNHVLQSANLAMKNGVSEEIVLACLLHDTVQELIKVDHGYWGAMLYEPYVSERVAFAIRYHQALRFYEDKDAGYGYPEIYRRMFGYDYQPEPHIEADYQMVRKHKWYMDARMVTVNDLYSFEPGVNPSLDQFADILGRHFKQPKEGLGNDSSPVAHMWRSIARPDLPL
jgi:hypothetical protein